VINSLFQVHEKNFRTFWVIIRIQFSGPTDGLMKVNLIKSREGHSKGFSILRLPDKDFHHRPLLTRFFYFQLLWPSFSSHRWAMSEQLLGKQGYICEKCYATTSIQH
jgi:hypothetical protein